MFADILKELRVKKRVSQTQLAKSLGVSPGNVGDWERGRSKPGYDALIGLSRFFEVSPAYLLGLENVNASGSIAATPKCDDALLDEPEMDLIAMYRFLNKDDKKTVYDIAKLKYEQATGEKESFYSTYFGEDEPPNDDPEDCETAHFGIA